MDDKMGSDKNQLTSRTESFVVKCQQYGQNTLKFEMNQTYIWISWASTINRVLSCDITAYTERIFLWWYAPNDGLQFDSRNDDDYWMVIWFCCVPCVWFYLFFCVCGQSHGYKAYAHLNRALHFSWNSMVLSFIVMIEFYYTDWSANHAHLSTTTQNPVKWSLFHSMKKANIQKKLEVKKVKVTKYKSLNTCI